MTLSTYCQILGMNKDDLLSRSRKHKLVLYRQVYCYLLWTSGEYKLKDISNIILLHHATILYSVEKIKDYISIEDKKVNKIIEIIKYK